MSSGDYSNTPHAFHFRALYKPQRYSECTHVAGQQETSTQARCMQVRCGMDPWKPMAGASGMTSATFTIRHQQAHHLDLGRSQDVAIASQPQRWLSTLLTSRRGLGPVRRLRTRVRLSQANKGAATSWSDAKTRVMKSYRDWLRAVCVFKQHERARILSAWDGTAAGKGMRMHGR